MMAENRHYIVIGLGSFGRALAEKLAKNGCRVTGIDSRAENVEPLKQLIYEAVIGDATDRGTLQHLPLDRCEAVFISLGEDITQSLLATLHVKELGARRVIAKGVTAEHGKILQKLGVERVVFPETEIARELADRMTWPNVVDFLPINPDYSFVEVAVPDSFVGRTLQDLNLRRRAGVWVVGVKDCMDDTKLQMFPDGLFTLGADQMLLVVGTQKDLTKLRELGGKG